MHSPPPRRLTGPGVRVLLVGTGTYEHLPSVPAVAQTLRDLGDALVDRCGLDPSNLRTLLDPPDPGSVGAALLTAANEASDVLLFYFVGHGLISPEGNLFLGTTSVARGPLLDWSGVPYDRVRAALLTTSARTTVVILDCCFSGRAVGTLADSSGTGAAADLASVEGSYVLTAAARDQLALAPEGELHTAFTGELLRLLATGDREAGPQLTLHDVYRALSRRLPARGLPKPHHRLSASAADLVLATNAAQVVPADDLLPEELKRALLDKLAWKRAGAVIELENQLSSTRPEVRQAAEQALLALVQDPDPIVVRRATDLWHSRGLGEIPLPSAVAATDTPHPPSRTPRLSLPAGIDFGTTNSGVAVFQDGECRVVPNRLGERSTPSVAALTPQGTWLVGTPARRQAPTNAHGTFASIKLLLGTDWQRRVFGSTVDAERVATVILTELRTAAEEYLGADLGAVVLTVPAYFDLGQRHATVLAAQNAGLDVRRLVNEPTAAALAFGVPEEERTVLVVDLGGGTLDVSVLETGEGIAEVLATTGDNHLGGDDWDRRITDRLVAKFRSDTSIDLTRDAVAMRRLREASEAAKIQLSSAQSALITVPYISVGEDHSPLSLEYTLSRSEFEALTRDLLERTGQLIAWAVREVEVFRNRMMEREHSAFTMDDIDTVILVGGATRMPAVGALVAEVTGKNPRRDIIPDGVAIGAAIQAAILTGLTEQALLLDVTPRDLGIETTAGNMTTLIARNTTIPTKRSEIFTTVEDDLTSVQIRIYQGEHEVAAENTLIGVFELSGIERASRGVPRIEVATDIDANGIVHVAAKDLTTAGEARFTVRRNLSPLQALDGTPSRIVRLDQAPATSLEAESAAPKAGRWSRTPRQPNA